MFIDSRSHPLKDIQTSVCIVGAGAAGISLAVKLASRSVDVCLLESGGLKPEVADQALSRGEVHLNVQSFSDRYLETSRVRAFGGTTHIWRGWSRPLDPIDFEARDWVPYSGWPIGLDELGPYYREAAGYLEIEPFDLDQRQEDPSGAVLHNDVITTKQFHFSPPVRFGEKYHDTLDRAHNVRVFLYANLVSIALHRDGGSVAHLVAKTLTGKQFRVQARQYVLACGGVENARLLLASRDVRPNGVGNERDLVGRFFLEHPHMRRCGEWVLTHPPAGVDRYDYRLRNQRPRRDLSVLAPTEATQRSHRLLNAGVQIERYVRKIEAVERVGAAFRCVDNDCAWREGEAGAAALTGQFYIRAEQQPDPENRVTLSHQRDALGLPRARLRWHLGGEDARTFREVMRLIGVELARATSGRARLLLSEDRPWRQVYGGCHQMGTTRMADNPARGVVDAHCRVHGVGNLYIAGSSVFPTGGFANPTLTLVALALRLADRLHRRA